MDKLDKKKVLMIAGGILLFLIIALIAVSLFSGGDETPQTGTQQGGNNQGGDTPNTGDSVTLEYWGLWESEEIMNPIIEQYEAANPGVQIVYTQRSFTNYEETLYTRLSEGGTTGSPAPDVFRINNTWLSRFQPVLSPLPANVMDPTTYGSTFYPTASADFTGTDGNIYAVPLMVDGLALFYNKEIFEAEGIQAPPTTWDETIDIAKQLTEKDANGNITRAGLAMGTSSNINHSADILSLLLLQNGVEINQNLNTEVDLTDDRAISTLEFYADFALVHEVWSNDLANDLELFYSGELPMMFGPSWRAFDIINANPSIEFGIAPTPNIGGQELYYSMYWAEGVYAQSPNAAQAWDFVKFMSEANQQQALFSNAVQIGGRAFGEPYSRTDLSGQLVNDPYAAAIMEMAPNMAAWKMGDQQFTEEALRVAINDVAVEEGSAIGAMTNAQDRINEQLAVIIQ